MRNARMSLVVGGAAIAASILAACQTESVGAVATNSSAPAPSGQPTLLPPGAGASDAAPPPSSNPFAAGPQPSFGETITQADPPPALSGGTLAITPDGTVVAADPDRDAIFIVGLASRSVAKVTLSKHDEPGRVAVDDGGRAHVVLRGGAAVVSIDVATGTLVGRRNVCSSPRGITFDAAGSRLLVACEGGELVSLPTTATGQATSLAKLDRDLRDVVVIDDRIFVSRFRNAEIIELSTRGTLVARHSAQTAVPGIHPGLAWRMIAPRADDTTREPVVVEQQPTSLSLSEQPGGYGVPAEPDAGPPVDAGTSDAGEGDGGISEPCSAGGPVLSVIANGFSGGMQLLPGHAVVPIDLARVAAGYAIVAAGNAHTKELPQIYVTPVGTGSACGVGARYFVRGQATAIAEYQGALVVQSREPAQLEIVTSGETISLDTESREDTGHAVFHSNSGRGLACATCHGEGGDDTQTWVFDVSGPRRTPSLRGTLKGTAPYHWSGDMNDIAVLAANVLTVRMSGPRLTAPQSTALESWLFELRAPVPVVAANPAAAARGKQLFESSSVGCTSCHSGALLTNATSVDVGTGGQFQVPSLIGVSTHAPYLHTGCAQTLRDRFDPMCGGFAHTSSSPLSNAQIDDLVSYLETL